MAMLTFEDYPDRGFDIRIEGLGIGAFVNDIKNTDLKSQKVSSETLCAAGYGDNRYVAGQCEHPHSRTTDTG